jgi:hypothetical protein
MATMAVSAATRAMNSAGRDFCIFKGLVKLLKAGDKRNNEDCQ